MSKATSVVASVMQQSRQRVPQSEYHPLNRNITNVWSPSVVENSF